MIKDKLKQIIKEETGVDLNDPYMVTCRKREFVQTRGIYYKILNHYTKFTLEHIGRDIGKTHATVLHAIRNFDYWVKYDGVLKDQYGKILEEFRKYVGINKLEGKLTYNIEEVMDNYVKLKEKYEELKELVEDNKY